MAKIGQEKLLGQRRKNLQYRCGERRLIKLELVSMEWSEEGEFVIWALRTGTNIYVAFNEGGKRV